METKKLNLEEMEKFEGGWSWEGCASGAISAGLTPVIATMWSPALAAGVLAAGCVAGGLDG